MATIRLPSDFSEFLKLLNSIGAEYLLIGGYAVNYYGSCRSTGDMDIWTSRRPVNAFKVASVLRGFGFSAATPEMLSEPDRIIRMGVPPLRLEILTSISGVDFEECYAKRELAEIEGMLVPVIRLEDLKRNKRASGRFKDLADLDELQ
jgi:predicted nucleotidyltransferase